MCSVLSTYLPLLREPGARRFMLGSAIGRLGDAMFGMALVAMVSQRTGSYALAGAVSAAGLVVLATTAVVAGRLVDRFGQRIIALPLVPWAAIWSVALVVASRDGWPSWTLFVFYALSAVVVAIGTLSRSRWAYLLRDRPTKVHSAMSLEQVVDELSFVLGPAVAIALATSVSPEAGFICAAVLHCIGTLLFLSDRASEPPTDKVAHAGTSLAIRTPGIILLATVLFMTGVIFGGNEVTVIAVTDELGRPGAAGLVIAVFAVGSAVAGLVFGARHLVRSLPLLLVAGTGFMFLAELPILLTGGVWSMGAVLLVAGAGTAPTLILSMQLAQRLVPPNQANEAMSIVLTGLLIGIAAGSALAGNVIEQFTPHTGFVVPVAAGGCAVLLAVVGRTLIGRTYSPPTA